MDSSRRKRFVPYVERLIQDAQDRGEFEGLPGAGRPLPDLRPDDPDWWIKKKMREEGLSSVLPATLTLRGDVPRRLAMLRRLHDEVLLRELLGELNERIREANAKQVTGPPSDVAPVDVEAFVADWRRRRAR